MADQFGDHLNVIPQVLTPEGIRVEKTLEEYKKEVDFPCFITGQVDDYPALKVSFSEPAQKEVIFEKPYLGADTLYSHAEQSQVGTAKKTIFLFNARKSKEYSNVIVLNDSWHKKVEAVCNQVGQALAPGARRVSAELHKLLIYSKGDFFNRHQDAQYSARMFATLNFFLPVKYSGGEFVLCSFKEEGMDEMIVKDKKMLDRCTWVAFYTDVRHRVNEIKEGFRVVLNYCLTFEGDMSPSQFLPKFSDSTSSLIQDYFTMSKKSLAIPLTYKYTLATLSSTFLKGFDACLSSALENITATELCFVLRFDKTKVIFDDNGYSNDRGEHKQIFQGVYVVKHEIAKKYFSIQQKFEKEAADLGDDGRAHRELRLKRSEEYAALKEEVKSSQGGQEIEWIDSSLASGPDWRKDLLSFAVGEGHFGWLGNTTPAAEYYYLSAALVVCEKK